MRVLFVLSSTRMSGGATKSFLTLLEGLRQKGVEPYVVTPDREGVYGYLQHNAVATVQFKYRKNVYPDFHGSMRNRMLFVPRLLYWRWLEHRAVGHFVRYCRENAIQLIHTNVSVVSCGMAAARALGIPHVQHVREYVDLDFGLHPYPSMAAFRRQMRGENRYTICITEGIQKHHGLCPPTSQVIYNGIRTAVETEPRPSSEKGTGFLFVGRVEQAKGLMQVVEALSLYTQQAGGGGATLKVAGEVVDVAYFRQIQAFLEEHGLRDKVEFLGNRQDVDSLMQEALAVIVASSSEAFGRCLPEAMLNHCITIGRDAGGTKEQYDNGLSLCGREIGLRYQTASELAARMQEVAAAPSGSFLQMKEDALAAVQRLYGTQLCVDKVYAFYQQILSK